MIRIQTEISTTLRSDAGGRLALFAAFALLFSASLASAAPRTWTDNTGKFSVSAELVAVRGTNVVLRKANGMELTVSIEQLSPADRRHLASRDVRDKTQPDVPETGVKLGKSVTRQVRIGMEFTGRGSSTGITGIVPVPMDWPEQKVRIVDQEKTPQVGRVSYRSLQDGARQMMIFVPRLRAGESARATVTFEVNRHSLEGPADTHGYQLPKRIRRELRHHLRPGPLTESTHAEIVAAKDRAVAGAETAWEQVKAIHALTLESVRYQKRDEIKSASVALREGVGDCQELSSLFVAMCRAHGVPARCVWIPRHSYAEFYLEDAQGRGHWFPVESTNKEQFGFLPRTEIILQKGDNFRLPEFREPLHYARTIVMGSDGPQPEFREIFEVIPDNQGGKSGR